MPGGAVLTGIIVVLRSGISQEMLPPEMGCGSGITFWRRLRGWQEAGVYARLHRVLLDRLREAGRIDLSRASLDSARIPAKQGAVGDPPARSKDSTAAPTVELGPSILERRSWDVAILHPLWNPDSLGSLLQSPDAAVPQLRPGSIQ